MTQTIRLHSYGSESFTDRPGTAAHPPIEHSPLLDYFETD